MKKSPKKQKKIDPLERIANSLEVLVSHVLSEKKSEGKIISKIVSPDTGDNPPINIKQYVAPGTATITITDHPDITTSGIMNLFRSKFKVWSYYDNERLDKDFPAPKEKTTRSFLKQQEPDTDTLGLSVKEFESRFDANCGITLRERLLLELAYFDETGDHLDVKGVTFCSGSRYSDGYVPRVCLRTDGEVGVDWGGLDGSFSKYGVRRAVYS